VSNNSLSFLNKYRHLISIFIVSFVIRSIESLAESLHIDEAFQIDVYNGDFLQTINTGVSWGRHPPLDFVVGWLLNLLPIDSVYIFRLPNVIFGSLTIVLIYLIIKEYFNSNIALFVSLGFSVWGPAISYSAYVRPYSSFIFLFILLIYVVFFHLHQSKSVLLIFVLFFFLPISRGIDGFIASTLLIFYIFIVSFKLNKFFRLFLYSISYSASSLMLYILFTKNDTGVVDPQLNKFDGINLGILDFFNFLIKFSPIYFLLFLFGLIICLTPVIVLRNTDRDAKFKINHIFVITLFQILINLVALRSFTSHGIYNRYFIMFLPLFLSCILLILVLYFNNNKFIRLICSIFLSILFIFSLGSGISEINNHKNLPFDYLNGRSDLVESTVVYLEGSDNQYLPGWPNTPGDIDRRHPAWLPYWMNSEQSNKFPDNLVLLARVDTEFGFLVTKRFQPERYDYLKNYGRIENISNGIIFYPESNSQYLNALKVIISKRSDPSEIGWLVTHYLKLKNSVSANQFDTLDYNLVCKVKNIPEIQLGPVFGKWGQTQSWADFILNQFSFDFKC
jgi:hypothetical protein